MSNKIKIIQASFPCSGSTILCNVLYGFFCPLMPIVFRPADSVPLIFPEDSQNSRFIYKSHIYKDTSLGLKLLDSDKHNIFLIMSERDKKYPKELRNHTKVLIFPFEDLAARDSYYPDSPHSLEWVISNIYEKLTEFLPPQLFCNESEMIESALKRVTSMNKVCEDIKDKPFSYFDKFYHVHGSHRGKKR